MQWINGILMAILVAGGYYGSVWLLDGKYKMGLKRNRKWLTDSFVLTAGIITLAGSVAVNYIHLSDFSFPQSILTMMFLYGMAILTVMDYKKHIIPNRILAIMALLWLAVTGSCLIFNINLGIALFGRSLAGALIGGIIFLLCYLVSRGQLGAGDVKLAFVMGLYLTGARIIGSIFYGTLICCAYSVIQIFRKKLTIKDGVPMAPFLYIGALITLILI